MLRKIVNRIKSVLIAFYCRTVKGVRLGKGVRFKNSPLVIRHPQAEIVIGKGTVINSSNRGYHISMFQPCKLYADRPGAKISIGSNTRVHGSCVHAFREITIGNNCLIAANCQIIDGNGHELLFDEPHKRIHSTDQGKPIVIEDDVWVAAGCTILGGTRIGQGSVITAGSVVKGDIPPRSLYGGNPGRLIKSY